MIGAYALASAFVGAGVTVLGAASQPGQVVQLRGPGACVSQLATGGICAPARAVNAPDALAVAPDGRTVYVASFGVPGTVSGNAGSLAVFVRNPATGRITQAQGASGCLGDVDSGCTGARGVDGASGVVVSPDGRNVYASGLHSHSIAAFARSPAGTLKQLPGAGGCLAADGANGCTAAPGLYGASDIAITRDGRSVYAAALDSQAVTSFTRDPATGRLTQLAGTAACIHQRSDDPDGGQDPGDDVGGIPLESCGNANGLTGPNAVEVSPDGTSVYVLSDSSLAVFRRAANGALSQQGCLSAEEAGDACTEVPELVGALALAIAPDGRTLYVASYYPGAILPFRRDPRTGALRELPPLGAGNALEGLADLAVTPDGGHLYAAAPGRDAILAFAVRADGTPAQLTGAAGCVSDVESEDACSHGEVLSRASAVEVSPDARHMYVTSVEPIGLGCACGEELGSVSAFARTPATLTVAKTAAPAGGIRSGKPFRISAQVKTSAKSATVTCAVRADGRLVTAIARYAGGVASCAGVAPKTAGGKTLSGTLTVTAGGASRRVGFTYAIV